MASKVAFLTGGTGYLGSQLAKTLSEEGWTLHLLVRPQSNRKVISPHLPRVHFHVYEDEKSSALSLARLLGSIQPETVFHLAAFYVAQHKPEEIEPLFHTNVLLGARLCEAMKLAGVYNLVNVGTSYQHFQSSPYNPAALYAATKQAFMDIVRYYTETCGIRAVHLKLFDTYGPHDPRPKLFSVLRKAIAKNEGLRMTPGDQYLDLVYISDIVRAFMKAQELVNSPEHKDQAFAVSSGHPLKLKEVIETYFKVVGKSVPIEWGYFGYRARDILEPWSAGSPLPGWQPQVTLDEGIRLMELASSY